MAFLVICFLPGIIEPSGIRCMGLLCLLFIFMLLLPLYACFAQCDSYGLLAVLYEGRPLRPFGITSSVKSAGLVFPHHLGNLLLLFGHRHYFRFPDGDTGQDCLAGLVFLLAIDRFSAVVILLAALAGRHAG